MVSEDAKRAVICAIHTRPGLNMDELILACTPYTWNEVFLALDELVRSGAVTLRHRGGLYMVSPKSKAKTVPGTNKEQPMARQTKPPSALQL